MIGAIERKIDLHQQRRTVLDDLFKALLQKLRTGEVCVDQREQSVLSANPTVKGAAM